MGGTEDVLPTTSQRFWIDARTGLCRPRRYSRQVVAPRAELMTP